jgi:mannose-6-phosphate isomerase-like protein (cupin superfamily)
MADAVRVDLAEKFASFDKHWSPKLVETLDGYDIKLVKIKGDFVWHKHDDLDEMFLVIKGRFCMKFRDRDVEIAAGQMIVVPKGVEHCPTAAEECEIMLFERAGVVNTGDAAPNKLTNPTERI